jgi:hypothetical protein
MDDNIHQTIIILAFIITTFFAIVFVVYVNTIGEESPYELGYIQETKNVCQDQIIWVKPQK